MQKQRKAKPAKRSSFQEGHIQIGYAIDLSKGKHADELKVKKCTHAKASSMEKSPNEAPFWRERGTDACRWIVDTPMLEQRKTYGCNKYPFYKNFPHPPRTSYLLPPTYLLMSSRIPRFFLISQTCFSHLIRIVESVSMESRSFPDSRDCPSRRRRRNPFLFSVCQNSTFLSLSSPIR